MWKLLPYEKLFILVRENFDFDRVVVVFFIFLNKFILLNHAVSCSGKKFISFISGYSGLFRARLILYEVPQNFGRLNGKNSIPGADMENMRSVHTEK